MNLTLTATFESVEEMQDWIVAQAAMLAPPAVIVKGKLPPEVFEEPTHSQVIRQVETRKGNLKADIEKLEEPAPKPKRKRRTKAEMAAARAAEEAEKNVSIERAADGDVGDEQTAEVSSGNGKDKITEPKISETELRRQYAEAFRSVLEDRLEEGIKLVQSAGLSRFSEGTIDQQVAILGTLGVDLTVR